MSMGLFIDAAYMSRAHKGLTDYVKLREHVETTLSDTVDEAYFFTADPDPAKVSKFHNMLAFPPPTGPGFRVKKYWLQTKLLYWPYVMGGAPVMHPEHPDTQYELTTQKAVDVGLVYHMVRSHNHRKWTKLVLAAGDADFHEPVQNLVESENVELHIVGTLSSISSSLRPYARSIFEIDREPLWSALRQKATVIQAQ